MSTHLIISILLLNSYVLTAPQDKIEELYYMCGSRLTRALAVVCKGNYNSPATKKSIKEILTSNDYNESVERNDGDGYLLNILFGLREYPNTFIPRRYRRAGVVDECCKNPCAISHLAIYCG